MATPNGASYQAILIAFHAEPQVPERNVDTPP